MDSSFSLPRSSSGQRLLLVDDNAAVREVLSKMATEADLEPNAVATGEQALASVAGAEAAGDPFAVVLLDWRMPGMDGLDCAAHLAVRKAAAQVSPAAAPLCVLMVTPFSRDQALRCARERGVTLGAVLAKPVTPTSLSDACYVALGRRLPKPADPATPLMTVSDYREKLKGRRVLLAEDNDINLELALELLRRVAVDALVARDGAEAVALLERHGVDAVLMDCQMPGTDGFEATRLIRARPRWQALPIIAMTANAMAGDREAAIAAGMNDHVAKPVQFEVLYDCMLKWLGGSARASSPKAVAVGLPSGAGTEFGSSGPLASLTGVDVILGRARALGDDALYGRMLSAFEQHHRAFPAAARAALAVGDSARLLRLTHAVRGGAATIGAVGVAQAASLLEEAALAGAAVEEMAPQVATLERAMCLLMGQLRTLEVARHAVPRSGW